MHSFGILSFQPSLSLHFYTGIASYAAKKGINCYLIHPKNIDFEKQEATGLVYSSDDERWQEGTFPIPTIIYNRLFYKDEREFKDYLPIITRLQSSPRHFFLGYSLPDKWMIYNKLKDNSQIKPYLPETKRMSHSLDIVKALEQWPAVIMKPSVGSQGVGIYLLMKRHDQIIVQTINRHGLVEKTFRPEQLKKWGKMLLAKQTYLLQPFLPLRDPQNRPFDLRIFFQRDHKGEWTELGRGLRIGKENHFLSNLRAGAEVHSYHNWLNTVLEERKKFIDEELSELTSMILEAIDSSYPPVFELCIDFGIGNDGALWLLEISSKLGTSVLLKISPEKKELLQKAPVDYAIHLIHLALKGAKLE